MKLLALDTALDACSAAIVADGAVLARVVSPGGRGNAERLLPVIEQARQAAGIVLADLGGIAATIGPGSFTGIRTALASARALGLALQVPVWGVTTTAVLAQAAARPGAATVAVIDARRGEVYIQCFAAAASGDAPGDAPGDPLGPPQLLALADAAAMLPPGPCRLVGSGTALLLSAAASRRDLAAADADPNPDPVLLARIAAALPVPDAPPAPLYIRPPDAALPAVVQPRARLAVRIIDAGTETLAVLAALHAEAFAGGEVWDAAALGDLLAMPGARAWLALAGEDPVGFLLMTAIADQADVITLAVPPRHRRLGVGRALLDAALLRLAAGGTASVFLEVAETNTAALALYERTGFRITDRRRAYYADGTDALVLRRDAGA